MHRKDHILIVDDDVELRALLTEYLEKAGYTVTAVRDGRAMQQTLAKSTVDLIVLDIMLPGDDGLTLCRNLRATDPDGPPILMLTARGDDNDRILGLELGADDYLSKPFVARELMARIRSIIRRTRAIPRNLRISDTARLLRFGDWRLDTVGRHLLDDAGTIIPLSGAEYRLLRTFLDYPHRVLSRDQLLNLTQGRESDPFDRSIDLLVSRLRQRLGDGAREPRYLKTVRSEGYVFTVDVSSEPRAAPAP